MCFFFFRQTYTRIAPGETTHGVKRLVASSRTTPADEVTRSIVKGTNTVVPPAGSDGRNHIRKFGIQERVVGQRTDQVQ